MYDLVIVGAGIAGLRVGIETIKKGMNCCILERFSVGGRISTFKKHFSVGQVQWEVGAGRISTSHKKVLALFKKYGLTFVPHSSDSYYDGVKNDFNELISIYLEPLYKLDPSVLATHTLKQLLDRIHGPNSFISKFPYYSEIHVLRADLALYAFQNEMGQNEMGQGGFGGCKEGLQALTDAMRDEFVSLGGSIFTGVTVTSVTKNTVFCKTDNMYNEFDTKKIVLAVPSTALKSIKGIRAPFLKYLKMQPLLRIYAVFSKPIKIPRIVTSSPIRYIIPVSSHAAMISYTDGEDARYWRKKDQDAVMKELRKILDVPDPIFFKKEYWADGCTYWLPGAYNVEEESAKSLKIGENVFLCGESYAVHQCWIESALEQADKLLKIIF